MTECLVNAIATRWYRMVSYSIAPPAAMAMVDRAIVETVVTFFFSLVQHIVRHTAPTHVQVMGHVATAQEGYVNVSTDGTV